MKGGESIDPRRPLRIVYLHQYFNTPSMSGGTRSYEFARRLVRAGHRVHMITSDRTGSGQIYETVEAGIRVTWIPARYSNSMGTLDRVKAFLRFAITSARIAAKSQADVVFATSTPLTIALPAVFASRRQRIPMVFEVRDLWPEMPIAVGALKDPFTKWVARRLERFAYQNSAQIVALSPGMKDGVVATGYSSDNVAMIPNSCDLELFSVDASRGKAFRSQFEWLQDRPLVVYTGTIGRLNGLQYMVRLAHSALNLDPNVRFVLVGVGKEQEAVERLAARLGVLDRNFFMLGSIEKSRVPDVLSAANLALSLFVDIKEMWSNSANKFFDALAAGKPVAVNYGGWQADILREHDAGLVLDPKDVEASARFLVGALHDERWLSEAGQRARCLAETQFNRDRLAAELEQVLLAAAK